MEYYRSKEEYISVLKTRSGLPEGFLTSVVSLEFHPEEKPVSGPFPMNLTLITVKEATELFGAVYTKNAFPGAPVTAGKKRLENRFIRGILINNKIANVCAPGGAEDTERILSSLAELSGCSPMEFIPCSTGIIGWKLPADKIIGALPGLVNNLKGGSVLPAAEAIMTTDSYPKVRHRKVGEGRVVGIAKGAGMIEPDMGTMLAFILTDLYIDRDKIRSLLQESADESFNRISIDGDQSTSDTAVLISSGKKECRDITALKCAVTDVCRELAEDIVRNGEGVGHVVKVSVTKAPSKELAVNIGKAVINSPLVKTAIFGNDPNVGRLIMSIGDYIGSHSLKLFPENLSVHLGGTEVFSRGIFRLDPDKENKLTQYLENCSIDTALHGYPQHDKKVEIDIEIGAGMETAEVIGSDLSYQYIKENADYRS
ncbi:MAG: bifunctional glutamate N-acetyltransferase/amino-acid acetyltransferase ArgJ [Spirochaetes bacterium]|nr:bifunctional glutamate N-acetyltransferase/amino-acid acetyltransferase ArgJ [Spirochaetota bacterium]